MDKMLKKMMLCELWTPLRCSIDGDSGGGSGVPSGAPSGGAVGGGSPAGESGGAPAPSPAPRSGITGAARPTSKIPTQQNVSSTREGSAEEPIDFDLFFGTPQPLSASERVVAGEGVPPGQQGITTQEPGQQPPAAPQSVVEAYVPPEVGQVAPQGAQQPPTQQSGVAPQQPSMAQQMPDYNNPGVLAMEMSRREPEMTQHVAQSVFALSPQDVEALQNDPASVVPLLMARAFVKSQQNTLQLLARLMPAQLAKHTVDMRRHAT